MCMCAKAYQFCPGDLSQSLPGITHPLPTHQMMGYALSIGCSADAGRIRFTSRITLSLKHGHLITKKEEGKAAPGHSPSLAMMFENNAIPSFVPVDLFLVPDPRSRSRDMEHDLDDDPEQMIQR